MPFVPAVAVSSCTLVVALPMFPCLYFVPPRFRRAPFVMSAAACGEEGRASCGFWHFPGSFHSWVVGWASLLLLGLRKMSAIDRLVGPTSVVYFRIRLGFELDFVFEGRRAHHPKCTLIVTYSVSYSADVTYLHKTSRAMNFKTIIRR